MTTILGAGDGNHSYGYIERLRLTAGSPENEKSNGISDSPKDCALSASADAHTEEGCVQLCFLEVLISY